MWGEVVLTKIEACSKLFAKQSCSNDDKACLCMCLEIVRNAATKGQALSYIISEARGKERLTLILNE